MLFPGSKTTCATWADSFGRAICFSRVLPDCDCGSVTWENQFCRSLKCGEEDFECLSTVGLIYRGVHYIYACMCTVSHVHTYVYIYIYIWYTVSNPLIFVMKSCLSRSTPFVFVFVHQLIESWCFTRPWEISKTSETPKTKNRHGNNMETTDIKHPWAWNDVKRRETAGAWPESVRTRPIECKAIGQCTWSVRDSACDKALRRTRNWRNDVKLQEHDLSRCEPGLSNAKQLANAPGPWGIVHVTRLWEEREIGETTWNAVKLQEHDLSRCEPGLSSAKQLANAPDPWGIVHLTRLWEGREIGEGEQTEQANGPMERHRSIGEREQTWNASATQRDRSCQRRSFSVSIWDVHWFSVRLCEEVLCQRFGRAVANWNSGWNSWSLANLDIVTDVTIPVFQSLWSQRPNKLVWGQANLWLQFQRQRSDRGLHFFEV